MRGSCFHHLREFLVKFIKALLVKSKQKRIKFPRLFEDLSLFRTVRIMPSVPSVNIRRLKCLNLPRSLTVLVPLTDSSLLRCGITERKVGL